MEPDELKVETKRVLIDRREREKKKQQHKS